MGHWKRTLRQRPMPSSTLRPRALMPDQGGPALRPGGKRRKLHVPPPHCRHLPRGAIARSAAPAAKRRQPSPPANLPATLGSLQPQLLQKWTKAKSRLALLPIVGTVRCLRSLHGPRHRPNGTGLSSAIMPAPSVATPSTRAPDHLAPQHCVVCGKERVEVLLELLLQWP